MGLLMTAVVWGCRPDAPSEPSPPAQKTAIQSSYVGDEACMSCHEDIYATFHQTGMGRSVSRFDPSKMSLPIPEDARVYEAKKDFYYEPFVRGDTLYQREFRLNADGEVTYDRSYPVEWVIGSGNATRSFLMNVNGYVTEMPLTWYAEDQKWDLSPGYTENNDRFSRPITEECMTCHNGRPEHSRFTRGHFTEVPLGITCERCHGPGGAHVDDRLSGFGPPEGEVDSTIVNPVRLERSRQLDVCQQCHLTGVTVLKPGSEMTGYQPGQPLAAHRTVYVTESELEDPNKFGIASHALRLAKSACFQSSDMTCTTCHDPHRPLSAQGLDHFNAACQSCHQPDEQEGPVCSRQEAHSMADAARGDCVGCHLQKGGTSDIPHVTFTDHWIRRYLPDRTDSLNAEVGAGQWNRETPFTLVRATDSTAERLTNDGLAALEEAIAYFEFYETRHAHPAYLERVKQKARQGLQLGADHPAARLAYARSLLRQDSLASAEKVLREAGRAYPEHARVLYWLGTARIRRGNAQGALDPLKRAWNIQPAFIEAGLKLGEALDELGQYDSAINVLQEVTRRDSVHLPEAWNNLGFVYLQKRSLVEALTHFERALALQPDMTIALVNAGTVHLMKQNLKEAVPFFERAIAADSTYTPAYGNLGLIYARMGRYEEARHMLQRVLELNPNDRRARALLEKLQNR